MDNAVMQSQGNLLRGVNYFQTTDFTHLHRMSNLIDYIRSVYRIHGRDTRLMTLSQDGTPLHISMIEYFTRFRDDILQRAKLTCFEELTVFHLLSYMGKKGYENGIGAMSAEARMAVVGGRVQSGMVKWMDNLTRVKTFIDTEGRTPSKKSGDADEKQLGEWISNSKRKEKGTNSEREKLMKKNIPLAFEDGRVQSDMVKWMDNLTRVKTFIDTEGRMPRENTGDADEKQLGRWMAANKRKEKGTNSEREKLMKKNIPLAFA
jgi:hypothetical protein